MAIVDNRLRPRRAIYDVYLLMFIDEQNLVGIDAVVSAAIYAVAVFAHTQRVMHGTVVREKFVINQPEVHNVSQRQQRKTEPRPHATCRYVAKFGRAIFESCKRTDRQTDR